MTIELTASVIVPTTILDTGAFTRSTTATYFDANGVMQTAPVDVPRIGYDPVTHAHTGLILEGEAKNVIENGTAYCAGTSTTASTGTATGPDLVLATKVLPNAGAVSFPDSGNTATQVFTNSQTVGQSTDYTFSGYFATFGPLNYQPHIVISAHTNPGNDLYCLAFFNASTGTFSGKTIHGGWSEINTLTATLATCGMWFVTWTVRLTQPALLRTKVISYIQVGDASASRIYTADGLSGIQRACHQFEVGSAATSYIPTTSAAVTRAADVVTGSGLVYCTTAEPASGETLWDAATSYTVGQVVARTTTHHLYENLIAGVNATLPENATTGVTPRWLDLGATNRWSQFDQKIGTATTSTTSLTTIVKPGLGEGLALLDLIGVTAKISATDAGSGVVIFERTVDLDSTTIESVFDWMFSDRVQKRNVVITDIPAQYPNMVVAVTIESTTGSAIGVFAVGRAIFIGATEYGAGAGIINFGKVTDDGFGSRTWIEGDWANRVTLPMVGNTSDFNRIHRQLATVRSTPCIYIGSALDSMEPLVCYGVFRDLYITVPNYPSIAMNLEIDGMSNS